MTTNEQDRGGQAFDKWWDTEGLQYVPFSTEPPQHAWVARKAWFAALAAAGVSVEPLNVADVARIIVEHTDAVQWKQPEADGHIARLTEALNRTARPLVEPLALRERLKGILGRWDAGNINAGELVEKVRAALSAEQPKSASGGQP